MVRRSIRLTQYILASATVLCVPAQAQQAILPGSCAEFLNITNPTKGSCGKNYSTILDPNSNLEVAQSAVVDLEFRRTKLDDCLSQVSAVDLELRALIKTGDQSLEGEISTLGQLQSESNGYDAKKVAAQGQTYTKEAVATFEACKTKAINYYNAFLPITIHPDCIQEKSLSEVPPSPARKEVQRIVGNFEGLREKIEQAKSNLRLIRTGCDAKIVTAKAIKSRADQAVAAVHSSTKPGSSNESEEQIAANETNQPSNAQASSLPTGGKFSNTPPSPSRGDRISGMGGGMVGPLGAALMAAASAMKPSGGGDQNSEPQKQSGAKPVAEKPKSTSAAEIAAQAAKDKAEADAFAASLAPNNQLNTVSVGTDPVTAKLNSSESGAVANASGRADGSPTTANTSSGHVASGTGPANTSVVTTVGAGRNLATGGTESLATKCTSKDKNSELCRIQAKRINDKKTEVYADPLLQSGVNQ